MGNCIELSIIILFCDKDYQYLEELISKIDCFVGVPYEIICVDNREQNKKRSINFGNARIISKGKNLYQLESRRWSVGFAKGKYIWFVDADDSVLTVDNTLLKYTKKNYDIITFKYRFNNNNDVYDVEEEKKRCFKLRYEICNNETFKNIGSSCWNKWFKKSLLVKVMRRIPKGTKITASEDMIIVLLALKYSHSFCHITNVLYEYNKERSLCSCDIIRSTDHFEHILFGHTDAVKIIKKNLTFKEIESLKLDSLIISDAAFFLGKILNCIPEIQIPATKILMEYFSKQEIRKAYHQRLPFFLSEQEVDEVGKVLKQEIPYL